MSIWTGTRKPSTEQMVKVVGHAMNKKKKVYENFVEKYGVKSE